MGRLSKMSNKYYADESMFDWCMVLVLEGYESIGEHSERKEWMRRFMEETDGKWVWKSNSNNEWGEEWRSLMENAFECMGDMPKSFQKAILNDIINDYSCRTDAYNDEPIFVNEIKDLATDDWINPDDERCEDCGQKEGHKDECVQKPIPLTIYSCWFSEQDGDDDEVQKLGQLLHDNPNRVFTVSFWTTPNCVSGEYLGKTYTVKEMDSLIMRWLYDDKDEHKDWAESWAVEVNA